MKNRYKLFLSFMILVVAFTKAPGQSSKNFTIQQLAPGVWAAIQNDKGGHAICNAGIIDLGNKTLIFDAFINPGAATELKQTAEQLTKHHVAYVVNSHFHDDHIRGTRSFMPGATVISTVWTRNAIQKSEPEEQAWAKKNIAGELQTEKQKLRSATTGQRDEELMWVGYYEAITQSLPALKTILPHITFNDSLWIHGTKTNVLLLECRNGHTGSDIIMLLPKEGIAFMGDLLFVQRHPWLGDGDPDSWKHHLQNLYNDAVIKTFVPGHGPVAGREHVHTLIQYITDLEQLAHASFKKGEPDSVFIKTPVLPQYNTWWYGRFYPGNLSFLYSREKGNESK